MKYILIIIIILLFIYIFRKNLEGFDLAPDKPTIVFSLTCHECDVCVYDLILNIQKNFEAFNIILLISISEALVDGFNSTIRDKNNKIKENIKIVTVRNSDDKMWGHMNLFNQHMLNVRHTIDENINYDYFWLVASNEMFIKRVQLEDIAFIHKYEKIDKYSEQEITEFYKEYETRHEGWDPEIIKNQHMLDVFKQNKMKIQIYQHEGLVLPKTLMEEIYHFYHNNELYERSNNKEFIMEELLVGSYLDAKYKFENFHVMNLRYNYTDTYKDLSPFKVLDKALQEPGICSIKPVARDMDDELRKLIDELH